MILETVSVGPMQVNCYILAVEKGSLAIIIDPGDQLRKIRQALDRHNLTPGPVINTHGHYDHIGCDDKFGVPVYIHREDAALLKNPELNFSAAFGLPFTVKSEIKTLEEDEVVGLQDLELKALHIPGHTPGGLALQLLKPQDKILFTGDTLFCGSIGRSDIPGGNGPLLIKGIREKLLPLSDDTLVYPGHGPSSTIGEEKKNNPYLT